MDDWQDRAACRTEPPATFFPHSRGAAQTAINICQTCPVLHACRNWANQYGTPYGVWGGYWHRPKVKTCADCQQELPMVSFTRTGDSVRAYCRDCHKIRTRQYRREAV